METSQGKRTQVRDAILSVPRIASLFQELLILNCWDVLGLLQDGVARSHIAQSLEQHDNFVVQDTSQFLRVSARVGYGIVEPPEVLLKYPPALLLDYVVGELAKVTPLRSAIPTGEPGRAVLCVETPQLAPFLYGCVVSCAGCGPVLLSSGSGQKDAEWEMRLGLSANAPLHDRQQAMLSACNPPSPMLTGPNLLGLTGSSSGNGKGPEKGLRRNPSLH